MGRNKPPREPKGQIDEFPPPQVLRGPRNLDTSSGPSGGKKGNKKKQGQCPPQEEVFSDDEGLDELGVPLDSVVKVWTVHSTPNFSLPWQRRKQHRSSGSGFCIDRERKIILTNAHCVDWHAQVKVQRRGCDTKHLARVVCVGWECDCAVLTVEDKEFWHGIQVVQLSKHVPHLEEPVLCVGFPVGGDTISVTSGVVSRVEVTAYAQTGAELLGVQIDAAINSGNSGGPAFNRLGECLGIAFQSLGADQAENVGFVIPTAVIMHFLNDLLKNGKYTGFPTLGIDHQTLENAHLREALGMKPRQKGILVSRIAPTCAAAKVLQPNDVLLKFDGEEIGNDGTVSFRKHERVAFSWLVAQKFHGQPAEISVLRDGKQLDFRIDDFHPETELVPRHLNGLSEEQQGPSYLIIAGLVFTHLSVPFLRSEFGEEWDCEAPVEFVKRVMNQRAKCADEKIVVLTQLLAHDLTVGYEDLENLILHTLNGTSVQNLQHMRELIDSCTGPILRFGLQTNLILILKTEAAKMATADVLEQHSIPAAMSPDLAGAASVAVPITKDSRKAQKAKRDAERRAAHSERQAQIEAGLSMDGPPKEGKPEQPSDFVATLAQAGAKGEAAPDSKAPTFDPGSLNTKAVIAWGRKKEESRPTLARPREDPDEEAVESTDASNTGKQNDLKIPDGRPHLNVVFIGHVDAGKSTTCGNILYLSDCVDERTIEKYQKEAKDKNRESWFLAYIMDTNDEEKAKGKTVEVGRATFETANRRFTILDAPGHKAYVPNMVAGASQADVGVLIISARKGEFETGFERGGQTREHAQLAKTLGVDKLIVAVNKMDDPSVEWAQERFDEISLKMTPFLKQQGYKEDQLLFLPISGLTGDNIKEKRKSPNWVQSKSLLDTLDGVEPPQRNAEASLRIPMLDGFKDMGHSIAIGKIEQGTVTPGMKCILMPVGHKCTVVSVRMRTDPKAETEEEMTFASCGENVTMRMHGVGEDQLQKGCVLCSLKDPIPVVAKFKAQLKILELPEERPVITRGYKCVIHLHVANEECEIFKLYETTYKKQREFKPDFALKDSTLTCSIVVARSVALDTFERTPQLGRFTLRDESKTIALGRVIELARSSS